MNTPKKKQLPMSIYLPESLYQRAQVLAEGQFCSMAAVIRQALQAHLDRVEKQAAMQFGG
mgnify:CR=1 FL=1